MLIEIGIAIEIGSCGEKLKIDRHPISDTDTDTDTDTDLEGARSSCAAGS